MPSAKVLASMPLTDQVPPLTVVVAVVIVWLTVSVMTTEIESPLSPVPLTARLLTLAMLTFGRAGEGRKRGDGNLRLVLGNGGGVARRVGFGGRIGDRAVGQTAGVDAADRPAAAADRGRRCRGRVTGGVGDHDGDRVAVVAGAGDRDAVDVGHV